MDFETLIAPLSAETFANEYWGRRPVHLKSQPGNPRGAIVDWDALNAMLAIRPHWTPAHIKLVMNSAPVVPDFYLDDVAGEGGVRRLANPAKVEMFLAMGASLVADSIQEIAPAVRALADMLARRFAAQVGANLYCSFRGVQAFASHCDVHDVFAIQCAGEKRWRIYENRADNPLETLTGEAAQATIDAAKGRVMMDLTMRSGDVLYIPRGFFHDALACDAQSLHLTMGVAPFSGKLVFRMLEEAAVRESLFRAYLPDARDADGAALRDHLAILGERIAAMIASPAFADQVAAQQRKLAPPIHDLNLPARPELRFYARTEVAADVVRADAGAMLVARGERLALGPLVEVAEYMLARPAYTIQELRARYAWHGHDAVDRLVTDAERMGVVRRYTPAR